MTATLIGDIGGTNARFALVDDGRVEDTQTLPVRDFARLEDAAHAYLARIDHEVGGAVFAVAISTAGLPSKMPNSPWLIHPETLSHELGVPVRLLNDLEAMGHFVAFANPKLTMLRGSSNALRDAEVLAVVGLGTGLGASLVGNRGEAPIVLALESGHIGFSPANALDDRLMSALRREYGRVSNERVASGGAIRDLAQLHAPGVELPKNGQLIWSSVLADEFPAADAILSHFLRLVGSAVGDIALASGARGIMIGGGLARRIGATRFQAGVFKWGLTDKGRYSSDVATIPIALMDDEEPGLLGCASLARTVQLG